MKLYYKSRDGRCEAYADYRNGNVVVKKGSRIRTENAKHFRQGRNRAYLCRSDSNLVSDEGIVLKDCSFNSVSIAAQFVTGAVLNGKMFWHLSDGTTLKNYLERI